MISVLKTVCRRMATVDTQRSVSPWRTKTAGPRRNSPLPIDAPRTMTPGPTTLTQPSPRGVGGAGSSARTHGSNPVRASGAAGVRAIGAGAVWFTSVAILWRARVRIADTSSRRLYQGEGLCISLEGLHVSPMGSPDLSLRQEADDLAQEAHEGEDLDRGHPGQSGDNFDE